MSAPASASTLFEPKPGWRQGFTLRDALRLLFKHKWLILFCFVTVGTLAGAGVAALPPTYISTAKVWVQIEAGGSPTFFSGIAAYRDPLQQDPANRTMENEMELAETWPVAAEAVKQTGLTYDEVYKSPLTHLMEFAITAYDWVSYTLLGVQAAEKHGFAETVALFLLSLEVKPIVSKSADSNSNIIGLTLRGTDPERTRQGLDGVVRNYIALQNKINTDIAGKAYAVVAAKVHQAQADVDGAQSRLEQFVAQGGVQGGGDPSLQADNQALPHAGTSATDALPSASGLLRTKPVGNAALRELSTPRDATTLAALKARLLDLQVQLVNRENLFHGAPGQNTALEGTIATLSDQLDREQKRGARDEATIAGLERSLRVSEGVLIDLQRRLSQIAIYVDMGNQQITNHVVVEPPLSARGSEWKQRAMVAVAGAVGGLFLGLALAGVREMLEQRLETTDAVRDYLGLPVIATLPVVRKAALRAVLDGSALGCRSNRAVHALTG